RNDAIMKHYNAFVEEPTIENVLRTLVYTILLEGMFFYSGFAFFYNLARHNKMVGTWTMVSYINRDELEHGGFIYVLFVATLCVYPEYTTAAFIDSVYEAFQESVELGIEWSTYVLEGLEGIDFVEMSGSIKYRANKMLRMMGLSEIYPEYVE